MAKKLSITSVSWTIPCFTYLETLIEKYAFVDIYYLDLNKPIHNFFQTAKEKFPKSNLQLIQLNSNFFPQTKEVWEYRKLITQNKINKIKKHVPSFLQIGNNLDLIKPLVRSIAIASVRQEYIVLDALKNTLKDFCDNSDVIYLTRILEQEEVDYICQNISFSPQAIAIQDPLAKVQRRIFFYPFWKQENKSSQENLDEKNILKPRREQSFQGDFDFVLFSQRDLTENELIYRIYKPLIIQLLSLENKVCLFFPLKGKKNSDDVEKLFGSEIFNNLFFHYKDFEKHTPKEYQNKYLKLFSHNKSLIKNLYFNPDIAKKDLVLYHNMLINSIPTILLAVNIQEFIDNFSFKNVIGEVGVHGISIFDILGKSEKRKFVTHAIQSGLAISTGTMDCLHFDHFYITDLYAKQLYQNEGIKDTQFHIVGNLEWEFTDTQENLAETKKNIEFIDKKSFTILFYDQILFSDPIKSKLYTQFVDAVYLLLLNFVRKYSNSYILIKPHPRDKMKYVEKLVPKHPNIIVLPINTSNTGLYSQIDLAISFYSNALYNTIAAGIPCLAVIPEDPGFNLHWLFDFLEAHGGFATSNLDVAKNWLEKYYEDGRFRNTFVNLARQLKIDIEKAPPTKKIVELLNISKISS